MANSADHDQEQSDLGSTLFDSSRSSLIWALHCLPRPVRLVIIMKRYLLQAFSSLAEAAYENIETPDDKNEPDTYCLSGYFEQIVEKLIHTADR